jgi:hypothetical protein
MHRITVVRLIAAFAVGVVAASASADVQQACESAKNRAAGKYAFCRQKAAARLATTGDGSHYIDAIGKCELKFSGVWQKAIDKAAAVSTTCLDAPLTAGDFDVVIASHADNVKTALAGGGLVEDCPSDLASCQGNLGTCEPAQHGEVLKTGQTSCYGTLNPWPQIDCTGTGQDGELQQGLARSYTDNGDGTITDNRTGLMWEKLSDDGSIHDWNDVPPSRSAAFGKVAALNSASFAGYTDWRLPNINELLSLVNYGHTYPAIDPVFNAGCAPGCSVTTCSCTNANFGVSGFHGYWSSTTYYGYPKVSWVVHFYDGDTGGSFVNVHVRAVRAASTPATTSAAGPHEICQAAKNKIAGKYAFCRQKAAAKLARTGDGSRYSDAIGKCELKFSGAWQKAIDKAAAASTTCVDAPLTAGDFDGVITSHADNVKTALAGGGLVEGCASDLASCQGNLGTCEAAQQGERLKTDQTSCFDSGPGSEIGCAGTGQDGELQQGLARSYTDNGDGTITDNRTDLMWEKLSDDGSIHDSDNTYTWSGAFDKVATLNSASFAGHTDWRLSNINELQSLVNYGSVSPAIDPVFNAACAPGCSVTTCSCTRSNIDYCSSTPAPGQRAPGYVWSVDFGSGGLGWTGKPYSHYVRAVRPGS